MSLTHNWVLAAVYVLLGRHNGRQVDFRRLPPIPESWVRPNHREYRGPSGQKPP